MLHIPPLLFKELLCLVGGYKFDYYAVRTFAHPAVEP
jgi:hypothetical protein